MTSHQRPNWCARRKRAVPHPAGDPRQPAPHPQRHPSSRAHRAAPGRAQRTASLYRGNLGAMHRSYGGLRAPRLQPAGAVSDTRSRHQPSTLHPRPPRSGVPVVAPCGGRPPQRTNPGGLGCPPSGEGCRAGAPTRRPRPTHQSGLPPHVRGALCTPGGSCLRGRRPVAAPSASRR